MPYRALAHGPLEPSPPRDLLAGFVTATVALPLCLGLAHAAGAPLHAGLISGILGGLVVGALSGSPIAVSGPAAGLTSIMVASIRDLGSFEAFLAAVLVAGFLQIAAGLLRGGAVADFLPGNVVRGLLAAVGVLLVLKQLPHLVGHDADWEGDMGFAQEDGQNTFSELIVAAERYLPGATAIGLASLALLAIWKRSPLGRTPVPPPIGVVLLAVAANEILRATGSPWAIADSHLVTVPTVGDGGTRWTDLLHTPDLSRVLSPRVLLAGLTLAVVASLESLLNLEAAEKLDPQRRTAPPDRELLAQGAGNVLAGLLGGLPMAATIARSSVNAQAGARSKLATMTHGAILLVAVLAVPGLLNRIPLSALAAILVVTGWRLAHPRTFRSMAKEGPAQFVPFAITVIAIVLSDLLVGVLVGLASAVVFILASNLRRGFRLVREDHVGGVVHRIELASQTSFLHRAKLARTLATFERGDQVVLDARLADYVDADVLVMLREFVDETAIARGIVVSTIGFRAQYDIADVVQYVDWTTKEIQASLTPERVVQLLQAGNDRFLSGNRLNRDLVRQLDATSDGQHPMAVVLSCIDSRSPAEILFDVGLGDLFNCRLAGNVASEKVLGSMEFACKVAGARLIVVLGHTRCGAVKATCDFTARGVDALTATGLTNLGAVTSSIEEAVRDEDSHRHVHGPRDGTNYEFVDSVARANVRVAMRWIEANSPVLAAMLRQKEIGMVGAMYDISSGRVEFLSPQD